MTEPKINVGILSGKRINFELYGDYKVSDISQALSGQFSAFIEGDKIICTRGEERYEAEKEVLFEPLNPNTDSFLLRDVVIGVRFHWERKEKQRFNGALHLLKDGDEITAINIIPVEKYLVSVISSEMSAKCSLQLLKAHAIISRGWLLAQINKSNELKETHKKYQTVYQTDEELIKWYDREDHKNFDVCADDHCQRYQGITKVFTEVARTAIKETAGMVLTYDGKICDTRFAKSCGGLSESFENVWEPTHYPYLTSIVDYKYEPENLDTDFTKEENAEKWIRSNPHAFCNTNDKKILSQILLDYDQETKDFYRWKAEYAQAELSALLLEKSGIDFGEIVDIIPVERGLSSRLIKVKIVGTKKTLTIGKELEIRRILSKTHLYSSAFIVEKSDIVNGIPQKITLLGAGWGHGVGLCQIGAAVMANKGYQFDEILLHYFKDAKLERIY